MKNIDKINETYIASRIFNTVYSLAKRCRLFSDIKDEIGLQIRNAVDMSVGLYSAVKIVDFIAKDIKNEIFTEIIEQNIKICVIMDEASTISNKPVLIIF